MRIAFFGGAFDPPHCGHLELARRVLEAGWTDRVLFVPVYAPPHEKGRKLSPFAARLQMLEFLLEGEPRMAVSGIEAELARTPSYTFEVMTEQARRLPGHRLQLLIGGDSLAQLHTWHRAGELIRRWEVIVYPRSGAKIDRDALASEFSPELAEKLLARVVTGMFFDISSTEIRKKLANHANIAGIMPKKVLKYIQEYQLYQKTRGGAKTAFPDEKRNCMTEEVKVNAAELAKFCAAAAEEKLAENVVEIKLEAENSIADYFVICTANSEPHLRSLGSFVERQVREKYRLRPFSEAGDSASGWILIDFVSVVVHIMTPEIRDRYSLESLWGGAPEHRAIRQLEEKTKR